MLAAVSTLLIVAPVRGQTSVSLPPADLGQTNILDADGRPGALIEMIALGYGADRVKDEKGDEVPGSQRQRIAAIILHPVYTSRVLFIGAHPGLEVLVPFSRVHNALGPGASGTKSGIGDVTIAPFLQWSSDPAHGRNLAVRASVQVVAPTGVRKLGRAVNLGIGAWQLSPYVAVTLHLPRGWDLSGRAILDRSGTGDSLQAGHPSGRVRPGDFVVVNFSMAREIARRFHLGVGGYYLQQTGKARVDGDPVGNHQHTLAAGPVTRWQFGRTNLLVAGYAEFAVRERPQGFNFNLRLQQPF